MRQTIQKVTCNACKKDIDAEPVLVVHGRWDNGHQTSAADFCGLACLEQWLSDSKEAERRCIQCGKDTSECDGEGLFWYERIG